MKLAEVADIIARMKRVYPVAVKWSILEASLAKDDPEALAFVAEKLDPAKIAELKRQRRSLARRESEGQRWEAQALDLEDPSYRGAAALIRKARGKSVWLYHGTSSKLVPRILREGILPQPPAKYAFLTARPGSFADVGGTARFYAEHAAGKHGGHPSLLRVIVPFDSLEFDPDDDDIETGRYQFVTDWVPPRLIYEVDGRRRHRR